MLKVFLVEDEFVVREGIKKNIDWTAHGYEFCGEASDGEQAFPLIQKLEPDIVITDIKMPFMDGLALSKLIKAKMPQVEIIILSGYSEFEYAKEAIKIGVAQYISKPINGEELLKEVDGLAEKIEEKRKERELKEQYRREMEENTVAEARNLFQYLVTGKKSVQELLELSEKLGMDLSAPWYNIVLVKIRFANDNQVEATLDEKQEEEVLSLLKREDVLFFDRNLEGVALLFQEESEEKLLQIQSEYLDDLKQKLSQYEQVQYFAGIGKPVSRLSELSTSFEMASHAFAHRFLAKSNYFFDSKELEQGIAESGNEADIFNIDTKQLDRSRIMNFLKQGEQSETVYFVEEFFKGIGESAMASVLFRQYIVMDIYFCIVEFVEGLELDRGQLEQPDMIKLAGGSTEDVVRYLTLTIAKAIALRDQVASNKYGDIVSIVKNYIDENYADENLNLNALARYVNFSPNHLSVVFSQQTGQTFIKYLTDYRMNKAKELLRCTGLKSSEISSKVGYKDSHYFSFLFKKTQGVTPTQFREKDIC